ncbi:hypothetical protein GpartN1_g5125.t1 [Galdieria partita]|uniref:Uncharacterized protein n=1 Tax=Galdieria partita TaxID=83374 RepID=A0A9C7PZC3_9RHOD|nr:hypothetical protein GpartN1_g5125.t1 [Galdieria partita]
MINLSVLDQLICEHYILEKSKDSIEIESELYFKQFVESKESLCSKIAARRALEEIIDSVTQAATTKVVKLLGEWQPQLLEDTRLHFQFLIMQLADKIEQHEEEAALEFCRKELAPKALNAYLEAYDDFKKALKFFLKPERIPYERQILADKLFATFQALNGTIDSCFYTCLKYLINIVCAEVTSKTELREETYQAMALLIPNLSQRPLPIEGYREFPESDIQTLKDALMNRVTRDDAVLALKYANGDIKKALKNELSLIHFDDDLVSSLVEDYIEMRGLRRSMDGSKLSHLLAEDKMDESLSWQTVIQMIRYCAERGDVFAILKLLRQLYPQMLEKYPKVHFRLLQYYLYDLLEERKWACGLNLLREDMNKVTQRFPQLYPWLKESAFILFLYDLEGYHFLERKRLWKRYFEEHINLPVMASSLCTIVMEANSIYEPQLAKNLRFYLLVHKEWCTKNQLDDPFAESLCIHALTDKDSLLEDMMYERDYIFNRDLNTTMKKNNFVEESASRQQTTEEQVILTLMEFLAISRAEAIALFNQYTGPSKDPAYILNTLLSEM